MPVDTIGWRLFALEFPPNGPTRTGEYLHIREQGLLDPAKLVFIDETSVNTNVVRLYGRCPCGVRLVDHVPFGQWETMTFVSALRHDGMVAPMLIEGPMNGELFLAYVEQCLAPTLKILTAFWALKADDVRVDIWHRNLVSQAYIATLRRARCQWRPRDISSSTVSMSQTVYIGMIERKSSVRRVIEILDHDGQISRNRVLSMFPDSPNVGLTSLIEVAANEAQPRI